jgi:hypothetical protein
MDWYDYTDQVTDMSHNGSWRSEKSSWLYSHSAGVQFTDSSQDGSWRSVEASMSSQAAPLHQRSPKQVEREGDRVYENCMKCDRWPGGRFLSTAYLAPKAPTGIDSAGQVPSHTDINASTRAAGHHPFAEMGTDSRPTVLASSQHFPHEWQHRPITCHNFVVLRPTVNDAWLLQQQAARLSGPIQPETEKLWEESEASSTSWKRVSFVSTSRDQVEHLQRDQSPNGKDPSSHTAGKAALNSKKCEDGALLENLGRDQDESTQLQAVEEQEKARPWWLHDEYRESPLPPDTATESDALLSCKVKSKLEQDSCTSDKRRMRSVPVVQLKIDEGSPDSLTPEIPCWPIFSVWPTPQHAMSMPINSSRTQNQSRNSVSLGMEKEGSVPFAVKGRPKRVDTEKGTKTESPKEQEAEKSLISSISGLTTAPVSQVWWKESFKKDSTPTGAISAASTVVPQLPSLCYDALRLAAASNKSKEQSAERELDCNRGERSSRKPRIDPAEISDHRAGLEQTTESAQGPWYPAQKRFSNEHRQAITRVQPQIIQPAKASDTGTRGTIHCSDHICAIQPSSIVLPEILLPSPSKRGVLLKSPSTFDTLQNNRPKLRVTQATADSDLFSKPLLTVTTVGFQPDVPTFLVDSASSVGKASVIQAKASNETASTFCDKSPGSKTEVAEPKYKDYAPSAASSAHKTEKCQHTKNGSTQVASNIRPIVLQTAFQPPRLPYAVLPEPAHPTGPGPGALASTTSSAHPLK